jgi:DNA-binding winged helix-turn-helix (wHTH) protein/tetratricopeptide (TPR) repeat protein
MNSESKVVYEFGPFRMDPDKQVLFRDNETVPVTPKAFETLLVLVRRSREVVSKDELLKAVWPDAFVEESNLSQNIFLLRKALGDTPKSRNYIVTSPGRGYRFAVEVRAVRESGEALVTQTLSRTRIVVEETEAETDEAVRSLPGLDRRKLPWGYILGACGALLVLLAVAIGAAWLMRKRQPVPLSEKDSVLVGEFANATADPVFDDTLREGLAVELEQSPFLSLVSEQRIQQSLGLMGLPPEVRLTGHVAQEICVRTGSAAYLEGSIKNIGTNFVLSLRSTNCRTGEVPDEEQVQVARKEEVLGAISQMANRFRTKVGESLSTIQEHNTPLEEATTPSLEALKAYSLGWKLIGPRGEEAALPFFRNAVDIDPNFASAYAALALMYGSTGSSDLATKSITKAYKLRDRASDREKFFITAYYFGRATGNQEKAQQVCEEWAQTYPRDFLPHAFLSGFVYPVLANYEKTGEESRKTIELDPDKGIGYLNLGYASIAMNRLPDAKDAVRRASDRKVEEPALAVLRYDIAFLEDNPGGTQREVNAAQGRSDAADWLLDREAFASASIGQLTKARKLSHQAVELGQQAGNLERAALFQTREALWEAFFGNAVEARRDAEAALNLARDREVEYGAGFALAMSGAASQAQSIANDLEKRFPEDTSVRFNYVPVIRALLALSRSNSPKAIDELQRSVPYELGSPRSAQQDFFGSLYPIYVRGLAYLSARNGGEAAREFRKILDHRGIMIGDPVVDLAYLGSARASALAGDKTKARGEYTEFLSRWKGADPEIPVLKQAKAELSSLR